MSFPNFSVPLSEIKRPLSELQMALSRGRQDADLVNSTAVMAALTDLESTIESGKKYIFQFDLRVNDSAAEGIQLDLNGGSATVSDIWATYEIFDLGLARIVHADALNDIASTDSLAGGDGLVRITGQLVASSDGTFIPRFAQASHTSGSLTVKKGSSVLLQEVL